MHVITDNSRQYIYISATLYKNQNRCFINRTCVWYTYYFFNWQLIWEIKYIFNSILVLYPTKQRHRAKYAWYKELATKNLLTEILIRRCALCSTVTNLKNIRPLISTHRGISLSQKTSEIIIYYFHLHETNNLTCKKSYKKSTDSEI